MEAVLQLHPTHNKMGTVIVTKMGTVIRAVISRPYLCCASVRYQALCGEILSHILYNYVNTKLPTYNDNDVHPLLFVV